MIPSLSALTGRDPTMSKKPMTKIRCECGRNLAWVYRAEHDRHHDVPQVGRVESRPGVEWSETAGLSRGWAAVCPKCQTHLEVSARAVDQAVAAGESELQAKSRA